MPPKTPEVEPQIVLEEVTPEVEQLQEAMGIFQKEMLLFIFRQESFTEEIAKKKVEFEKRKREMDDRSEEIKQCQEEVNQRHREAALALDVATHLAHVNAQAIEKPDLQEAQKDYTGQKSPLRRIDSRGPY